MTAIVAVALEGASLAPSPLKHATTLGAPAPICAPVTLGNDALALQLVVQLLAGTKPADPNAVPVHDEPE